MEALPIPQPAISQSASTTYPIVTAKLRAPALTEQVIDRPRLRPRDDVLEQSLLTVVVAPAGYGKSVAAAQLAQAADATVCWLTIEPAENDSARFLRYVCAALPFDPIEATAILDRPAANEPEHVQAASDQLRFELGRLDTPIVLVLDDFHELENPSILEAIAEWATVPPASFALVCVSRREPQLPLDRLRSQGRLHEVRTQDLRFTSEETAAANSQALPAITASVPARTEALRLAEGWITGSNLAAMAPSTHHEQEALPYSGAGTVGRYFATEVLDHLPAETVRFMVATCIVDSLPPELADALTGREDSPSFLRSLVDQLCFTERIPGDEAGFRYHPMLREHLLTRLADEPLNFRNELYERAARWFEARGDLTQAFHWASRSNNVDLGKRFFRNSWRVATRPGNFEALRNWAVSVGPDGTDDPLVCVVLAWAALSSRNDSEMRYWATRAETFAGGTSATASQVPLSLIAAHWNGRAGDIMAMNHHAKAALALLGPLPSEGPSEQSATTRDTVTEVHAGAVCLAGTAAFLTGDTDESLELLESAARFARNTAREDTLLVCLSFLAMIDVFAGRTDRALVRADEAILRWERARVDTQAVVLAYAAQAAVGLQTGDDQKALDAIARAQKLGQPGEHPVETGLIELQLARVYHYRGALSEARASLQVARDLRRACSASILDREIRRFENELRFIAVGPNDQLPESARELTEREFEIVRLLPGPRSRSELALDLHISENTVKTHLSSISRKLDAHGRTEIVRRAQQLGLLSPVSPTGDFEGGR